MANIKEALGSLTAITITLASLGSFAAREATLVDNTTNLYLDAILSGKIRMGAAASAGDVYVLLNANDTSINLTPATGSDAAITVTQIDKFGGLQMGQKVPGTELIFLGVIPAASFAAAGDVKFLFGSIAAAFGGNLPPKWAPIFVNCTGQALDSTGGNFVIDYTGVFATSV